MNVAHELLHPQEISIEVLLKKPNNAATRNSFKKKSVIMFVMIVFNRHDTTISTHHNYDAFMFEKRYFSAQII